MQQVYKGCLVRLRELLSGMDFQGVVSNPYFKPQASGRLLQLQSESSVNDDDEDDDLEQGISTDTDFIMSLKTFTSAYELELKDLIQDLNKELERVSVSNDEVDGDVQVDQASLGGSDGVDVGHGSVNGVDVGLGAGVDDSSDMGCEEIRGEVDRALLCRQVSSEDDCDATEVAVAVQPSVINHANGTGANLKQSSSCVIHVVRKEFDDYELLLQEAILDLSSLSAVLVGCLCPGSFVIFVLHCSGCVKQV